MARAAAQAGLAQFEGMHRLRPENSDALLMLLKGWAGYGFAFAEDDYEDDVTHDRDDQAEVDKARAKHAYDRAINYGRALLAQYDGGFTEAKKRDAPLRVWLDKNFRDKDDAEALYWFGTAWMLRVNLLKDDPAQVATLFVAPAFLERARKLDEGYNYFGAGMSLAAYHARNAVAELPESRAMFEDTLQKTGGKSLMVQLNYAMRYACIARDRALFDRMLGAVDAAGDPDPSLERGETAKPEARLRLMNVIAKRKAKRARGKAFLEECGFSEAPR